MLTELRVAGAILAVLIGAYGILRFRQGAAGKTTLTLALVAAVLLAAVAIEPGFVFGLRDLLGISGAPLSGLVVALILAVGILFILLLGASGRIDDTRHRLDRLVAGLARKTLVVPDGTPRPGIAVILPALNEADNLDVLLTRIPRQLAGLDVVAIVVDDGSTDATPAIAVRDRAIVVSHPINQGGGAALRLGYQVALELGATIVVTMDADGQHDPAQMERLVSPILEDRADFVIGSRLKGEHEAASVIRHVGIYLFNGLISILARRKITDCSSGYRAIRAADLDRLHLAENQFHTSETILLAVKAGLRLEEVPVTIARRHSGVSKKPKAMRYGWGFLRAIVRAWWR
jgi:hypothetical protein